MDDNFGLTDVKLQMLIFSEAKVYYDNPDDEAIEACKAYGKEFVEFLG